ncbi:MAG: pilus assembly protein TadG-related protein [Caulobacteraceae bacterium]
MSILRVKSRTRSGSVSVMAALLMPVVLGMAGLAVDYGNGVLSKVADQRVADLAAFAGAAAYNATGSTTTMAQVAENVAALNGVASNEVAASLVNSPSGDGSQAVQVSISTSSPLYFAQVITPAAQISVGAQAFAELNSNAQGCIIALGGSGAGLTLTSGTSVSADACAVASNATISAPCGASIVTIAVDYANGAPSEPCNGITAPSGGSLRLLKVTTPDPLAGSLGVATATNRLASVIALSSPAAPSVPAGTSIAFGWSQSTTQSEATAAGCSASFSSSTWTLTCPSGGTYDFGSVTVGGGISVNFNTGGSASTTYDFGGSIDNSGSSMTFGPGTYNIAGGLITGGGTTTAFAAGTFNIGTSSSSCNGEAKFSICNTGSSLAFGGPSAFDLTAGIYNAGGSSLSMGSGSTNSYVIGKASDGNAIWLGGGSKTAFADATSGLFQLVGNLDVASGGGSCLQLPAAPQHDIDGNFATAGGTILGAGVYTVHGYIALGGNGGGDVSCWGSTIGMVGNSVTLVTDGASTPSSGNCKGAAFCVASGYADIALTAPSSGATAQIVAIGPLSSFNSASAIFAEGSGTTSLSGAFYFPNGPVSLSGGATLASQSGQCLELIGSQVSLNGGSAVASKCVSTSIASAGAVLVQ